MQDEQISGNAITLRTDCRLDMWRIWTNWKKYYLKWILELRINNDGHISLCTIFNKITGKIIYRKNWLNSEDGQNLSKILKEETCLIDFRNFMDKQKWSIEQKKFHSSSILHWFYRPTQCNKVIVLDRSRTRSAEIAVSLSQSRVKRQLNYLAGFFQSPKYCLWILFTRLVPHIVIHLSICYRHLAICLLFRLLVGKLAHLLSPLLIKVFGNNHGLFPILWYCQVYSMGLGRIRNYQSKIYMMVWNTSMRT